MLFCSSCGRGQGLAGCWGPDVNKTTSACLQAAHRAARSLAGKSPDTIRGSTCPQTTFSGFPGAGKLPLSAGLSAGNLITWTPYPAGKGEPLKVIDVFSQGQETAYTETFVSVPELWLICLLGYSHNNTCFLSYSWKNKTGREHLTLETSNTSKSSQGNKIFRTHVRFCKALSKNRF